MAFDDVAPATEPEPIRPNGQRAQQRHAPDRFVTRNIGMIVELITYQGMLIVAKGAFDMNQGSPARTIKILVDGRKRNAPIRIIG